MNSGILAVVERTMSRAPNYLNILIAEQLHPSMASVSHTENEILQQDYALWHKALTALEWFEKHKEELQLMSWSFNLPDPNYIEHM